MSKVQSRPTTLLANLPWRTARRDIRAVTRLLDRAELERDSALRGELEAMFHERVSDCRDFFVLRGVRARRPTVLQMAGRSLSADRDQIARLDRITPGMGFPLLHALSQLIESWAKSGRLVLA